MPACVLSLPVLFCRKVRLLFSSLKLISHLGLQIFSGIHHHLFNGQKAVNQISFCGNFLRIPLQMESDRLDSQVSVDSWAESQMSHRTMSEPFFSFPSLL